MNVSCPECRSVFRIDPAKVPDAGVRARCSVCGAVMAIASEPAADTRPQHASMSIVSVPPAAAHPEQAAAESDRAARPTPAAEPTGDVARVSVAEVPDPVPVARPVNPYLSNTPELRARRLARALVSDLVAYNPQKREQGLRDGTLRQLFREEIRKSWDEYVEQVGATVAESTPHFQDALNDVLAGGRRVF